MSRKSKTTQPKPSAAEAPETEATPEPEAPASEPPADPAPEAEPEAAPETVATVAMPSTLVLAQIPRGSELRAELREHLLLEHQRTGDAAKTVEAVAQWLAGEVDWPAVIRTALERGPIAEDEAVIAGVLDTILQAALKGD